MSADLCLTILSGSLCSAMSGTLATISAWFLADEWRWRRVRWHLVTVLLSVFGLVASLAFGALASLAWAEVFR